MLEIAKKHRKRNREYIVRYLAEHPCVDCGESNPVVLEFDHRDPTEKKYQVSFMSRAAYAISTIDAEIAKCDVRCANCHRKRHAAEDNWSTLQILR